MNRIAPYAKAVIGFIAPGLVALVAALNDGSPSGSAVTNGEWLTILSACVVTGAGVYAVPNRRRTSRRVPVRD